MTSVPAMLIVARAAAKHLLEQDPGLNGAEKHDELQIRNIDPRRKQIDGYGNRRELPIAKLTDALKRAVHRRAAGDFLDERVTLPEDLPGDFDELIGMGSV